MRHRNVQLFRSKSIESRVMVDLECSHGRPSKYRMRRMPCGNLNRGILHTCSGGRLVEKAQRCEQKTDCFVGEDHASERHKGPSTADYSLRLRQGKDLSRKLMSHCHAVPYPTLQKRDRMIRGHNKKKTASFKHATSLHDMKILRIYSTVN